MMYWGEEFPEDDDSSTEPPRDPLVDLIDAGDWEQARKKFKRIRKPERISALLHACSQESATPDDVLDSLLTQGEKHGFNDFFYISSSGNFDFCDDNLDIYQLCYNCSASFLRRMIKVMIEQWKGYINRASQPVPFDRITERLKRIIHDIWYDLRHEDTADKLKLDIDDITCINLLRQSSDEGIQGLLRIWDKIEILVKATFLDCDLDEPVNNIPFVHQIIKLELPKTLVWIGMRMYTQQLGTKDANGRIPLHAIAEVHGRFRRDDWEDFPDCFDLEASQRKLKELDGLSLIEVVLNVFPEGASMEDKEGMVPLDVLLDSEYNAWRGYSQTLPCAIALAKQYPEALNRSNRRNPNMLPFMVATCIHEKHRDRSYFSRDMLQHKLDLTFALLLEDPTVVTCGIKLTADEQRLTTKLEKATTRIRQLEGENQQLAEENKKLKEGQEHLLDENKKLKEELAHLQESKKDAPSMPDDSVEPSLKRQRV